MFDWIKYPLTYDKEEIAKLLQLATPVPYDRDIYVCTMGRVPEGLRDDQVVFCLRVSSHGTLAFLSIDPLVFYQHMQKGSVYSFYIIDEEVWTKVLTGPL